MTLSSSPWWCAPVRAFASMVTVPAHRRVAPVSPVVTAARRFMPGVCGVFASSSPARTTRTPSRRHREDGLLTGPSGLLCSARASVLHREEAVMVTGQSFDPTSIGVTAARTMRDHWQLFLLEGIALVVLGML